MPKDDKPKNTTAYLLGEINGKVEAVNGKITQQNGAIAQQNTAIDELKKSVNGLAAHVSKLPCSIHEDRINNIINLAAEKANEEKEETTGKKRARRELMIALISAVVTGVFMLVGVLIARGG